MFKNYLKIAWRNLWKNRLFTSINIVGLSVAFAVATLLVMDSLNELSYDSFHENGDQLYKTYITWQTPKGTEIGTSMPTPFSEALKSEVPGVQKITQFLEENALLFYKEKEINLDAVWVAPDFFSMFTLPILQGNKTNPLQDLSSVVISEAAASKLFGDENPIDKVVNILINGKQEPFTIRAVTKENTNESSLEFEIAIPFEKNASYVPTKERWGAQYHDVLVQLEKGVSAKAFEKNSNAFTNLHYKNSIEKLKRDGALPDANGQFLQLGLLPIKEIHFTSFNTGVAETSRTSVYLVLGVAFLILFIACVNFINMSIAKSSQRLREIGMRKTLGAEKRQLFFQFWGESLLVFTVSIGVGILLSILLLDNFQALFRTSASFEVLLSSKVLVGAIVLIFSITLIVGGYPALLLSRLGTIQSLKGKLETSGGNRLRDALIVVQFGIAILLISGTLVLWGQVEFMRNKDLGYNKEQVFSFPINGKKNSYDAIKLLRQELSGNPDILGISASDINLGRGRDGSQYTSVWGFDYKGKSVKTNALVVDYDYIETLGLELLQGRNFEINRKTDAQAVVINESMAKELGEKNPLEAKIAINDTLAYPVIGVVKDYNFQDVSKAIEPLTFLLDRTEGLNYAFVKVNPVNMANSVESIEAAYKKIEPNATFLGSFLDENVDRTFRREKTMATLITTGSIIAIILSCIGLFAMSLLIVAQRTKEIGIRKVIGASVSSITYILTKDFLRLVFIAFIIASPIAWWLGKEWLQNYAYHMNLNWSLFVISGATAVLIALLTIGTKTIRAAMQNPIDSLRDE